MRSESFHWRDRKGHLASVAVFFPVYMLWFAYLEKNVVPRYIIRSDFDALIPFNEYFVIPYMLWFVFMFGFAAYFLVFEPDVFRRMAAFLYTGMIVSLLIYSLWPNGQPLRPYAFPRDNVCTDIVRQLYRTDTPTNVCPSIHVFNTLGIQIAIGLSPSLRKRRWVQALTMLLSVSIILSTVFLKQHSIIDGFAAGALAVVLYIAVYRFDFPFVLAHMREAREERARRRERRAMWRG